jgi:tetratricopeptide (TPR) repeat protein
MSLVRPMLALLAALTLPLASCSTAPSQSSVARDVKDGKLEDAAKKLEEIQKDDPDNYHTRMSLGDMYFALARKSLDEKDHAKYYEYLGSAQSNVLAAARLDPQSPEPHTKLGIISLYAGDLKGSEVAFYNALKLAMVEAKRYGGSYGNGSGSGQGPQYGGDGFYWSNLAQVEVFKGDLAAARRHLVKATKAHSPQSELDFVGILIAWKENDMVEARDIFNGAKLTSPQFATTWDGAKLPKKMESFEDFAAACCANLSCGPYMEKACVRERLEVASRSAAGQVVAEKERIERERREKLREIYEKKSKKEVDVTLEEDPNAPKKESSDKAPEPEPAKK